MNNNDENKEFNKGYYRYSWNTNSWVGETGKQGKETRNTGKGRELGKQGRETRNTGNSRRDGNKREEKLRTHWRVGELRTRGRETRNTGKGRELGTQRRVEETGTQVWEIRNTEG